MKVCVRGAVNDKAAALFTRAFYLALACPRSGELKITRLPSLVYSTLSTLSILYSILSFLSSLLLLTHTQQTTTNKQTNKQTIKQLNEQTDASPVRLCNRARRCEVGAVACARKGPRQVPPSAFFAFAFGFG